MTYIIKRIRMNLWLYQQMGMSERISIRMRVRGILIDNKKRPNVRYKI